MFVNELTFFFDIPTIQVITTRFSNLNIYHYLFGAILAGSLLLLSWIDYRRQILPDKITLPLILLGCIQSWVLNHQVITSIIGAVIGYSLFILIEKGYASLRRQNGLGRGDAKLLAAGGAWCGYIFIPQIIFIGSMSAILSLLIAAMFNKNEKIKRTTRIAFGPFLSLGIFITWVMTIFQSWSFMSA